MVRVTGLEPACLTTYEPKGDVTLVKILWFCALIKNFNMPTELVHLIPASLRVAVHQGPYLAECINYITAVELDTPKSSATSVLLTRSCWNSISNIF